MRTQWLICLIVVAVSAILFSCNKSPTGPAGPAAPTLVAPANNAANQPVSPTLSWDRETSATSYDVLVSTESTFGTTVFMQAGSSADSVNTGILANGTTYFWQANAANAAGTGPCSAVRRFTTAP